MTTVFYRDRIPSGALVNPTDSTKPVENFPEVCISTYSEKIIEKFASLDHVEVIASLYTANGIIPVYKMRYAGKEIAFYLSRVGAPACICGFEETIAMGAKKFVFFGCCGILNDELVMRLLLRDRKNPDHRCHLPRNRRGHHPAERIRLCGCGYGIFCSSGCCRIQECGAGTIFLWC